jgi:hypothetical protein
MSKFLLTCCFAVLKILRSSGSLELVFLHTSVFSRGLGNNNREDWDSVARQLDRLYQSNIWDGCRLKCGVASSCWAYIYGNVIQYEWQFILQSVCIDISCKKTLEKERSDETVKNDVGPRICWVLILEFTFCRFVTILFQPRRWVERVICFFTSELGFVSECIHFDYKVLYYEAASFVLKVQQRWNCSFHN